MSITKKTMTRLMTLPTDPSTLPGVASVVAEDSRMVVEFTNGLTATVARSPLAAFSRRKSFDVWLPSSRPGFAGDVVPSKSPEEVIAMLTELAAKAASHCPGKVGSDSC